MRKLFISQPVSKKTDEDMEDVRIRGLLAAAEKLGDSIELIDSLLDADCAYFADGWETESGCRVEHELAVEHGIEIVQD